MNEINRFPESAAEGNCPECGRPLKWIANPHEELVPRPDCPVCMALPGDTAGR